MTERAEGPDEGLREPRVADLRDALSDFRESVARADAAFSHGVEHSKMDDAYVAAMDAARVLAHTADAVLPLLTAERERAEALQRQLDGARALALGAADAYGHGGDLTTADAFQVIGSIAAALSRPTPGEVAPNKGDSQ